MNLYQRLAKVQDELKVPKNQKNTFGNYNYRSCEDIVENAKPLCVANGLVLTLSDEIVTISDRVYIKATAEIIDVESSDKYQITGFAREELTKKGMDGSQITGAASSYARKYALNGLFAIDDTKDSDSTNEHGKGPVKKELPYKKPAPKTTSKPEPKKDITKNPAPKSKMPLTSVQIRSKLKGQSKEHLDKIFKKYNVFVIEELKNAQLVEIAKLMKWSQ
jgi:hypothetical protein